MKKMFLSALLAVSVLAPAAHAGMDNARLEQALRQLDQADANIQQARSAIYQALQSGASFTCTMSSGLGVYTATGSSEENARDNVMQVCLSKNSSSGPLCKQLRDSNTFTTCHR